MASDAAHQQGYKQAGTATPGPRTGGTKQRTPPTRTERNRRYRARQLAANPEWEHRRRHQFRQASAQRLTEHATRIIGWIIEGEAERKIAESLNVSFEAVRSLREYYECPTPTTIKRRKREVLAWFYREQGLSEQEVSHRTGIPRRFLRTIPHPIQRTA